MIPTKDKLDELAEEYRNELLEDAEEYVMEQVMEAKAHGYSNVIVPTTETVRSWMLNEIGKKYEKEGYRVSYGTNYSFSNCGITIIVDDEKYDEEERMWRERHIITPSKKWWEFWK